MNIKVLLFTKQNLSIRYSNILYRFFKDTWSESFQELGIKGSKLADEYCRFDTKIAIFNDLEPVAFHAYQFFDLNHNPECEHHYFSQLDDPLVNNLKSSGVQKAVSLEYLCVNKKYRKKYGYNWGDTMIGISIHILKELDIDVILGITRNNRSINTISKKFGGEVLFQNIPLNNTNVDVITFYPQKVTKHPDSEIQKLVDQLKQQVNLSDIVPAIRKVS